MTVSYIMRAFKTSAPTGHVYWAVLGAPDFTGDQSGYNPADLTEIAIDYEISVPINGEGGISQVGLAGGDLTGVYPDPTVADIGGVSVATGVITAFNVKTYGATGLGVADETAAIQSAINAMTTE